MVMIDPFFHDKASKRARLANGILPFVGKPVLSYFPLFGPTFKLLTLADKVGEMKPVAKGLYQQTFEIGGNKAHLFTPKHLSSNDLVIYFHGGAYLAGGLGTHKIFVEHLALKAGARVLNLAYRQYPKAKLATSAEDCIAAVRWAIETGWEPENIIVAGDSAGGGLAVTVAGTLAAEGIKLHKVVSISGWLDFSSDEKKESRWVSEDAYIPLRRLDYVAAMVNGGPLKESDSPITHIDENFPDLLLICGAREILRVDSDKAYSICVGHDIPVELHYFRSGIHAFPVATNLFPESAEALDVINEFINRKDLPMDA